MPYVMRKKDAPLNATGNDLLEGFCIDLLEAIAAELSFKYTLYLVPDAKFGAEDSDGTWNGMVRELVDKKADLAVAPMTINFARETVIDFTKPFMNLGIGILFKLPSAMPRRLFAFMSPLDVDIWFYILAAYVAVSGSLFVVARLTPMEWVPNESDQQRQRDVIQQQYNQFTCPNAYWFNIVTLMHQGVDMNPRAFSTRIIGAMWWFFCLIIISSYTANLAAFLTVERMMTPIENVDDLASQSKISYGTLESGSTMTFFRDSKMETYQKMWTYMKNHRDNLFVKSYDEGVARVLQGNYAFLMESTMIDYLVQRDCNLTQVGGLLDSKGYGIATPMGSPWRDQISLAILNLQEKGLIQVFYNKWWRSSGTSCSRDDKNKEAKASALGFENIGGVFVVLLAGLLCAIAIAVMEFCWYAVVRDRTPCSDVPGAVSREAKLAFNCMASHKRRKETPIGRSGIPGWCHDCRRCGSCSPSRRHHQQDMDRDVGRYNNQRIRSYNQQDDVRNRKYYANHMMSGGGRMTTTTGNYGQCDNNDHHCHHHHQQHQNHRRRRSSSPSMIPPPPHPPTLDAQLPMMDMSSVVGQSFDSCPDCQPCPRVIMPPDLHPAIHGDPCPHHQSSSGPAGDHDMMIQSPDAFDNDLIASASVCQPTQQQQQLQAKQEDEDRTCSPQPQANQRTPGSHRRYRP